MSHPFGESGTLFWSAGSSVGSRGAATRAGSGERPRTGASAQCESRPDQGSRRVARHPSVAQANMVEPTVRPLEAIMDSGPATWPEVVAPGTLFAGWHLWPPLLLQVHTAQSQSPLDCELQAPRKAWAAFVAAAAAKLPH